jgi:hypothetical protein
MNYLTKRKIRTIEEELRITEDYVSIIHDLQPEELIEKMALIDVLFYGKDLFLKDPKPRFKITKKIISQLNLSKDQNERLEIHQHFLEKYQKFAETEYQKGKLNLQREFLLRAGV